MAKFIVGFKTIVVQHLMVEANSKEEAIKIVSTDDRAEGIYDTENDEIEKTLGVGECYTLEEFNKRYE